MSISFVLITFLFQMAVGMVATVTILPTDLVDRRFFKSIGFWSMLFTGLGLAFRHYAQFHLPDVFRNGGNGGYARFLFYAFGLLCFQFWAKIRLTNFRISRPELILISLVGLAALVLDAWGFRPAIPPMWAQNFLIPLNFVSVGLLLGAFLSGMIFGHYYLVDVEMPKKLLVTMAGILIAAMVLRIASFGTTLVLYKFLVKPDTDFLSTLTSFQGHGIFFWQRVLVGLVIPSVVVAMIYSTARIGSNQSATGIMYVAVAFVFIGELAARYLFLLSAIPL